jgi:hypothetical protein
MIGSSSAQWEFVCSADDVSDRSQFMKGNGHSHDDRQLPVQVYRLKQSSFVVAPLVNTSGKRGAPRTGELQIISGAMAAALWLPEPLVT